MLIINKITGIKNIMKSEINFNTKSFDFATI